MKALGFGAVVWDDIPAGFPGKQPVRPPADSTAQNLGGAVLNVLVHLQRLGNQAAMVSGLGRDTLGDRAYEAMQEMGIRTAWVSRVAKPTPLVRVEFDDTGEPSYRVGGHLSCDYISLSASDIELIDRERFDTFCFGSFEQRQPCSRNSLETLLENVAFERVFLDVNLRTPFYNAGVIAYSLQQCTIAKLSVDEAVVLQEMLGFDVCDIEGIAQRLRERFDISQICVTDGARGAYYSDGQTFGFCRAYSIVTADAVGAGDAFSAGLLHRLQNGDPLEAACDFACRMGALVASKTSSIPHYTLAEVEALTPNPY